MLGKGNQGGGFRYLHDEISGGLASYSHLKTRAAYSGDLITVGGLSPTNYGFVNNIVPLSTIQADYPSQDEVNFWYDQLTFGNDITGSADDWSGTDFQDTVFGTTNGRGGIATIDNADWGLDFNSPFSLAIVINQTVSDNSTKSLFSIRDALVTRTRFGADLRNTEIRFYIENTTANILRCGFGTFTSTGSDTLIIFTYDGSYSPTGMNVYVNDMTTARTRTTQLNTLAGTGFAPNRFYLGWEGQGQNNLSGFSKEAFPFGKELDATERETAKEILEQYYTFP